MDDLPDSAVGRIEEISNEVEMSPVSGAKRVSVVQASTIFYDTPATLGYIPPLYRDQKRVEQVLIYDSEKASIYKR